MRTEWNNKMITVISWIRIINTQATGLLEKVNVFVLDLLQENSFANLFWTYCGKTLLPTCSGP